MQKKISRGGKIALVLLLLLVVGSTIFLIAQAHFFAPALTAVVQADGKTVLTLSLAEEQDQILSLETLCGHPVLLEIKAHQIRVFSSDCPDQICVRAGWLKKSRDLAVCMPNRISVVLK